MTDIITQNTQLPTTIEDLSRFVIVGREQLAAIRAAMRAIDKVGAAKEFRDQRLEEAQTIAEAVLDAEVRIGELMAQVPKTSGGDRKSENFKKDSGVPFEKTKLQTIEDAGFTKKQVQRYEAIARHPDLIAEAKAEARENEEVVTRAAVLKKIKKQEDENAKAERNTLIAEQIARPKTSAHVDIYTTERKYRIIYADPPWSYNDKQNTDKLGGAEKHYPTMSIDELCALPIPAENDAVLFMWVTSPLLEDCFAVINAWGFKYKSSFVWDKVKHNMGHYNSVRHELLLVCTKGSCLPDVKQLFDSVVTIDRPEEHSKKPDVFRNMIDTLYPIGNRLEMFAREAPDGWDVWGNMA